MNTFTPFEITDTCDPTQTATPRPQKRNHRRHSIRKSKANRQPLVMSSPHSKRPTVLGIDVKSAPFLARQDTPKSSQTGVSSCDKERPRKHLRYTESCKRNKQNECLTAFNA